MKTHAGERYYVWEMGRRERMNPIRQVNSHPLALLPAKQLARIGATEGKHDRAVTTSPKGTGFRVIAQYEQGSGRDITAELYRRRRRNPPPPPPESE